MTEQDRALCERLNDYFNDKDNAKAIDRIRTLYAENEELRRHVNAMAEAAGQLLERYHIMGCGAGPEALRTQTALANFNLWQIDGKEG